MAVQWAQVLNFVQGLGKNKGQQGGGMSDAERRKYEQMRQDLANQRIEQMRPKGFPR